MSIRVVSTAFIAAGIAFQASAGVTYTSQTRTLRCMAGFPELDGGVNPVSHFGPIDRSIEFVAANPAPNPDSRGFASQRSSMTQDGIRFTGLCEGTDNYGGDGGIGSGESILDVTFIYDGAASDWSITATGPSDIFSRTILLFERVGPVSELLVSKQSISEAPPWSAMGVMTPGTYRFRATVLGGYSGAGSGSGGGAYDMTLTIPSPATLTLLGLGGLGVVRRRRA